MPNGFGATAFAAIGAGYVVRDAGGFCDDDPAGVSLGASVGFVTTLDSDREPEFCPVAGLSWISVSGDYYGTPHTLSQTYLRVGGLWVRAYITPVLIEGPQDDDAVTIDAAPCSIGRPGRGLERPDGDSDEDAWREYSIWTTNRLSG